jgi:pyroglutamyl-peptidase
MPARVLLTAFEPFGGSDVNASAVVASCLAVYDPAIEVLTLPVTRGAAEAALIRRLEGGPTPALCVSLGEADDRPMVRLEKVAVNWDDFRIPDNGGNQPRDEAIRSDGPAAYFSTVPVAKITRLLEGQTPLTAVVSLTAGAFVCNHLAYAVLDWLAEHPICPYLFIHVPRWRQGGDLSLEDVVETVRSVLDAAVYPEGFGPIDTPRGGPL